MTGLATPNRRLTRLPATEAEETSTFLLTRTTARILLLIGAKKIKKNYFYS